MFERFKAHGKWRSIIAIEKAEVKISLALSLLFLAFLIALNIFDNYVTFKDALQTMISGFIAGYIALLGFSLSAVAIVASLFSKRDIQRLDQKDPNSIENMLASFEYLGLVTAVSIISLSTAYITMEVDWPFHPVLFYIAAFIVVYLIFFTMFYTVSLTGNCVKLYTMKLDE